MTFRDMIVVSFGNLTRLKLRTSLTSAGILISIAAFVSMLSFGAGNQQYLEKQFNELGLFSTMQVYPKTGVNSSDTSSAPQLDSTALNRISKIPGVNLVYPYDAFTVFVRFGDTVVTSKAQALSPSAINTKLFSRFAAGGGFDSISSRKVIISEALMNNAGIKQADSLIGKPIVVSVRVSTIDSALYHILIDKGVSLIDRARRIHFDSLAKSSYRSRLLRTEANEVARRFMNGFLNAQEEIKETLTVCGVRSMIGGVGRLRVEPVIIPFATASRFKASGINSDPMSMLTAFNQGTLFSGPESAGKQSFPQLTIDFDPKVFHKSISDSVEAMGFRTFSFAAQFEEIQRVFLYFNLALALIGLIALVTASLGIINTMIMSIIERRKEIGILKSLGADERDIRALFLVESGVIGILGTVGGILFGWAIARVASAVAQAFMKNQGVPQVDLFALPAWLVLIALAIGVGVSVLAGYYPASRAARVDPVEALRNE